MLTTVNLGKSSGGIFRIIILIHLTLFPKKKLFSFIFLSDLELPGFRVKVGKSKNPGDKICMRGQMCNMS